MKKVVIIGGGIAGMTAGVLFQKADPLRCHFVLLKNTKHVVV